MDLLTDSHGTVSQQQLLMNPGSPLSGGGGSSANKPAYCTPNPVPNVPENNQVKLIDYRGAKIAAFTVEGRELICLPQSFELFLKHLVGGLHTVYTKLKRLEVTPVVCNVEQVRILRSLGAIQPGVNRCKLIAPKEFDVLYEDCTNSSSARPGRPPKRSNTASPDCQMSESIKRGSSHHFDSVGQARTSDLTSLSFRFPLGEDTKKLLAGGGASNPGVAGGPNHAPPPPFASAYYPGCGPPGPHHHLGAMMPFLPFPPPPPPPPHSSAAGGTGVTGGGGLSSLSPSAAVFYHQTRFLHHATSHHHQQAAAAAAAAAVQAATGGGGGSLVAAAAAAAAAAAQMGRGGSGPVRFGGMRGDSTFSGKHSPNDESPSEFLQNPLDNNLPSESSGSEIESGGENKPSSRSRAKNGSPLGLSSSPPPPTHLHHLHFRRGLLGLPPTSSGGVGGSGSPPHLSLHHLHQHLHHLHNNNNNSAASAIGLHHQHPPLHHHHNNSLGPLRRSASVDGGTPRGDEEGEEREGGSSHQDLELEDRDQGSPLESSHYPARPNSVPVWPAVGDQFERSALEEAPHSISNIPPLDTCVMEIENLLRTVAENARAIERFQATASYDLRNAMNAEHQKVKLIKQKLFEEKQRKTIFQKKWKKERRLRLKLEELMSCLQSQGGNVDRGGGNSRTNGDSSEPSGTEKPQAGY